MSYLLKVGTVSKVYPYLVSLERPLRDAGPHAATSFIGTIAARAYWELSHQSCGLSTFTFGIKTKVKIPLKTFLRNTSENTVFCDIGTSKEKNL